MEMDLNVSTKLAIKVKLNDDELRVMIESLRLLKSPEVRNVIKKLMNKRRKLRLNIATTHRSCRACLRSFKSNSKFITRHHLIPKASFVSNEERLIQQPKRPTIGLCLDCHNLVHHNLGDGHEFRGPTTRRNLIRWIRLKNAKTLDQHAERAIL